MKRREAIKRASLMMGGALSASAISAVMSGCKATPVGLDWKPVYLSEEQGSLITEIAERILPTTETPGAKDAGVHHFIDIFLKDCASDEEKSTFEAGLQEVETRSNQKHSKSFVQLTADQMDEILLDLASKVGKQADDDIAGRLANEGEAAQGGTIDTKDFFNGIRQLTILGYFTSEIGATLALKMDQIPGDYIGCVDYADIGGAWALD